MSDKLVDTNSEIEIYYVIKIGNMFLGSESRLRPYTDNIVLTSNSNKIKEFWLSEYQDENEDVIKLINRYIAKINENGIENISVIEKKTVITKTNTEVTLARYFNGADKIAPTSDDE